MTIGEATKYKGPSASNEVFLKVRFEKRKVDFGESAYRSIPPALESSVKSSKYTFLKE